MYLSLPVHFVVNRIPIKHSLLKSSYLSLYSFLSQEIFLFLTKQLRGLEDPDSASFKRYFYLLEVSTV